MSALMEVVRSELGRKGSVPDWVKQTSNANRERLYALQDWLETVGPEATTEAFIAYANAIGCPTVFRFNKGGPPFPLLSEALSEAFGPIPDVLAHEPFKLMVRARLLDIIGTNEDAALAAFASRFAGEGEST
jgi:hypothetical protein